MKRIYFLYGILAVCLAFWGFMFFKSYYESKITCEFSHDYFGTLSYIHKTLKPEVYLEIGVDNGTSINLTHPETHAIGIDPVRKPKLKLNDNVTFYKMESDKFFADKAIMKKEFSQKKANMSFIDGMHLYEYVLRDFINVEKVSNPNSVVFLHDTLPVSKEMSKRMEKWDGRAWTGDVYKIIPILKKYRPDLDVKIINSEPSGLCIVSNLDPNSKILEENYDKIIKEFKNYSYEDIVEFEKQNFKLIKPTEKNLKKLLKKSTKVKEKEVLFPKFPFFQGLKAQ